MSIFQDIVNPPKGRGFKDHIRINRPKKDKHEKEIKYCERCNRCHQESMLKHYGVQTVYFHDFPKIGLPKEICVECEHIRTLCVMCNNDVPRQIPASEFIGKYAPMVDNLSLGPSGELVCNRCSNETL
jgi:hypothetical protein